MKKKITLTGAFGNYDRIRALDLDSLRESAIELQVEHLPPSEIFARMCKDQEFDVSEMSMGAYCYLAGQPDNPFVALPAFPSRAFRHSMVYYHAGSGIEKPLDLNGKKIAIREWGMPALVWIVGILGDQYGFDLHTIDWVAAKQPRVPLKMPVGTTIRYMEDGQNLSDMLASGEVDAALIHQAPACFTTGLTHIRRLFPDYKSAEIEYYRQTAIHPIMHCVVVRRDVCQRAPRILETIYQALLKARQQTLEALSDTKAFAVMIPMLPGYMKETRQIFGENFWPYGLEQNRKTLDVLARYAFEQGLSPRKLTIEELFPESYSG
ncbi:MAG: ABC transporter substrate-binding protein [Desulfofustis sp.]|nr:ABC transporter substrate-binding protein [Desulfofustis sp.]